MRRVTLSGRCVALACALASEDGGRSWQSWMPRLPTPRGLDLSLDEICARLDIAADNCHVILHRSRRHLRALPCGGCGTQGK